MKIKKLELKNINSYGNNLQTIEFSDDGGLILLFAKNGMGKCLLKGSKVRMFDGGLKMVEELRIGDTLMGPDSKKRTITQLYNDFCDMYKIEQKKGIDYIVTENHVLSLKKCGDNNNYLMSVSEYLKLSKSKKRLFTCHISKSIEYDEKTVLINPYILGLWLGDGTSAEPAITNIEPEIISEIYEYANLSNFSIIKKSEYTYNIVNENGNKEVSKLDNNDNIIETFKSAKSAYISNGYKGMKIQDAIKKNYKTQGYKYKYTNEYNLRDLLNKYNLLNNKHIPKDYLTNSRKIRLELLAGLLDTDGYVKNNSVSIVQKNYTLIKQIEELCNSLGFKTNVYPITKKIKKINFEGKYWNLSISSNNLSDIPFRVDRKKKNVKNGIFQKDRSRTGINISYYGYDEYCGFSLDEDPLFLLEDYTVTHNSTIKQAIELCTFGKVQGKNGKRLNLNKLPNRRNGNLYTSINFENHNGDNIIMSKNISPNNFDISINSEPFTERFKQLSEKEREKIIGYSYEIFKSFISLNINDFKNFISLSKEDKENLLNKLFNLSELDVLMSITKDINKANIENIENYDDLIYNNDQKILKYKESINKIKDNKNIDNKKKELKEKILEKQPIFIELQDNIKKCDDKILDLKNKSNKLYNLKINKEKEKTKTELKIDNLKEKIYHYENGICPICNTTLIDDSHQSELDKIKTDIIELEGNIKDFNLYLDRCILEDAKIKNSNNSTYKEKEKNKSDLDLLISELSLLKSELKLLKEDDTNIDEFNNLISITENENKEHKITINNLTEKSNSYEELIKIFSFEGVRKSIIANALKPINIYLNEFLDELDSEYKATLNDNFDATIFELETLEIDPETLSKGEDKKINIAIALSYLKIILELKRTNLIFLDEIFDGVDIDNVDLILKLLRKISKEYKINIIIVHHNMLDKNLFDRIINIKKDIFSNIEEIQ